MKRLIPVGCLLFVVFMPTGLRAEVVGFPDNHTVRQGLANTIVAPISTVLATPSGIYQNLVGGMPVRFEVLTQDGGAYLLFTNEEAGQFPLDSKGSYIIKRNEHDGSFVQVKIFLNGNPESFVRIFPMGERSRMDVYLYGFKLYQDITVPVDFRQLLTDPFSKVMALTRSMIEWPLIFPGRPIPEDGTVVDMVRRIRKRLPSLTDHDDGAMNSNGEFVYIKNLQALSRGGFNCSGFAKWVIDGLYRPRTGRLISIEALKEKHLSVRGNSWSSPYEKTRDPYFGLDWSRNLALELTRLDNPSAGPRSDDVTNVPFFTYTDNVGYPIRHLAFILYELAVRNPGYFYLGAVNRDFGHNPVLREYTHVVVLFPYFDSHGLFQVAVMERNLESGLGALEERYPNDYVHLERVEASTNFAPPMPPSGSTNTSLGS